MRVIVYNICCGGRIEHWWLMTRARNLLSDDPSTSSMKKVCHYIIYLCLSNYVSLCLYLSISHRVLYVFVWLSLKASFTRGGQKVRSLIQLTTEYEHDILSLFNIVPSNRNALGQSINQSINHKNLYSASYKLMNGSA